MGRSSHSNKRRDVEKRLRAEGWTVLRRGPGDHVQYTHPAKKGRVTVDAGEMEFKTSTLRSIFTQAGWIW